MSKPSSPDSAAYYDLHAQSFEVDTVRLEMERLYLPFLHRLPAGGTVLDAGCGPGRDALAFQQRGFQVEAFDASGEMVRLAAARLGRPVTQSRFQDLVAIDRYDGIWACASLLHVPASELPDVFKRLEQALKPSGMLYLSFKYGQGERQRGDRLFTDLDEAGLGQLVAGTAGLRTEECWITGDLREGRAHERWLNAILVNSGS